MIILGIETSCDETAAALVKNGRQIRSFVVSSSLKEHTKYGGIIPEIASRRQLELINLVVKKTLANAKFTLKDIDAIAVTTSPGLIGSLLVGVSFARALSFALNKPLIEVDHIKAHLYANFLAFRKKGKEKLPSSKPKLPAIGLVVSGGHTSLFYLINFHDIRLLGHTRDDAAGEAFDKVARLLNLGYPGGPIIDKLAKKGKNDQIRFPQANLPESADFSFSGLKTAVLYYVRKHNAKTPLPVKKIAYAFQKSVVSSLVSKSMDICKKKKINTLLVGGGVAANSSLREELLLEGGKNKINVFLPMPSLCIDNAAMVAGLAYHLKERRS